jgi:hypothetical protein
MKPGKTVTQGPPVAMSTDNHVHRLRQIRRQALTDSLKRAA